MASRICSQCGQEAPRTAKFCPQCASSLTGEPTIPRPPQHVEQRKINAAATQTKTVLISVLALALVIVLVLAVLAYRKFSSVISANSATVSAPPIVQAAPAPQIVAPPVTQAPTAPTVTPPVTQAPQAAPQIAPPAIVAYLAFLQQIEQTRTNLDNAQVAAILPLLGTADGLKTDDDADRTSGTNQIDQAMTANLAKWQDLIKQFQAEAPPGGCEDLANTYYKFLQDYTDLSSQIQVALENGDTAKVMALQGAQTQVDQDATNADSALTDVCDKFNAKKLFTISSGDSGPGASLLGG